MKLAIQGHNEVRGEVDIGISCSLGSNLVIDSEKTIIRWVLGRYSLEKCPHCDFENPSLSVVPETRKQVLVV